MRGVQHLLLLAVFALLARCQQKPQAKVSMSPILKQIFSGDLFFLKCDSSTSGSNVTWYINNTIQTMTNDTWKIRVATPKNSGSYQCKSGSNMQMSDAFSLKVLDYFPSASLTIKTGQPVVRPGDSVVLQLEHEDGLQGWKCFVHRAGKTMMIQLRLLNDNVSVFQPKRLTIPETIFWCSDTKKQRRSNQITVRTSEKDVSLEMYTLPAVVGDSLILKCLAWGTDDINRTIFYKNNAVIQDGIGYTYKISFVKESARGSYKCEATFTHKARTEGPPYDVVSDDQDMFIHAPAMKAFLSANYGLSCSCPLCPNNISYHWYYKNNGQPWALLTSRQGFITPKETGTYACRAVWNDGRSSLSSGHVYQVPKFNLTVVVIVLVMVVLVLVAGFIFIWYKKRHATGRIYEDMPMKSQGEYEMLQKGGQKEGEYDTLHPEAPGRQKKEGEYESLKKEEMTEGEYHTVRMEGAVGGEGGYEALKKEGRKEEVYHTLGMEGAAGEGGGYEALKKKGREEGVYHTLGMEGAAEEGGGYEALKKEGRKEGVYHTLGMEGAAGEVSEEVEKKDKE
ncbi:uncharacterized protein LOC116671356 isoform X1 [Etheostoma spectabile]|uniref:uncharacterized protein LOC116671356 isoform X1 n=1 Tax=Etheostoma spectabile TaxID=54343 RepID=UPI0013AEC13E|nr:uncharacterized protein LOC116671356 isoform X1 [Etheostoma spectabile]